MYHKWAQQPCERLPSRQEDVFCNLQQLVSAAPLEGAQGAVSWSQGRGERGGLVPEWCLQMAVAARASGPA